MVFFFFNDTATTEIYTLSLHDALPICGKKRPQPLCGSDAVCFSGTAAPELSCGARANVGQTDRKSTRLNSSHQIISYAVFCLKKKKNKKQTNKICADDVNRDYMRLERK